MILHVRDCMTPEPKTLGTRLPISIAREVMRRFEIRHVPILESGRLVGLIGERELSLAGDAMDDPISRWMNPGPFTVTPGDSLAEVANVMAENKLEAVVVVDRDVVVGVLTSVDLARALADLAHESERRLAV